MTASSKPTCLLILVGPNGAGKSTLAPYLIRDALGISEFVNADEIARGLSAYAPETVAFAAGRSMLARLKELASKRATFAFETTLATQTFVPWIETLRRDGYRCALSFVWLPGPDTAIERVRQRVREGGHSVPEGTVRRRYIRGLRNLFALYLPLMDRWTVYNGISPRLDAIAQGGSGKGTDVFDDAKWQAIRAAR